MDSEPGAAQASILTILMGKSDNLCSCRRWPSNAESQLIRTGSASNGFHAFDGLRSRFEIIGGQG